MISALFYSWLVLLILTVIDTKGHIYWTSNEQFLCKRHLDELKDDEFAKLQEGVSCKLEVQTGSPNQCRNRNKDNERKEGLWWTLPIPPMEVEGLLENKPAIKPGVILAEKPHTSSSRDAVDSSTASAVRRSSTTSLPNSSLQRSNVLPANAGPKGEARSSSTMKINAVTTLAELVSSSTALSAVVTSVKDKSNAKIFQIQKPPAQPVSTHVHYHQHHQHQGVMNAYPQCLASNKVANNAVSSGNKAITSIKSSASNVKAAPAKHIANKVKHRKHFHSIAGQMAGFVLQDPHKRQVQACSDSLTSESKNIENASLRLSSAPKGSELGKVATNQSSFNNGIKPNQPNRSDVKDQQLNHLQSVMNLKSNPSIPGYAMFCPKQNEFPPVLSFRQQEKMDIQCIVPLQQVYKHPNPSYRDLDFTVRFVEMSSTSVELPTTDATHEPSKATDVSKATKSSTEMDEYEELTTVNVKPCPNKSPPDSDSHPTSSEEPLNSENSETSEPKMPTHPHLKPYPGDQSHLVNSNRIKNNGKNIHSNGTGILLGQQVSLKGVSAPSRQQISGQTNNLEAKNSSFQSYKIKQQGLSVKMKSNEQDDSRIFHDKPLNIKKSGKTCPKLIKQTLKEPKEPPLKEKGLELITLLGPSKTEEKSFQKVNPNQPLLDHNSLPLLSANFIDYTILSDDNFLNNNIQSNETNEEEEEQS